MNWKHYTCEISGKPALVLVDDRFQEQAPIHELPRVSWFGVHCNQSPGADLWSPDEEQTLDSIEDDLIKLCEAFGRGWAVYVLRIATPGMREYYLYHSSAAELNKAFESLKTLHPSYKIESEAKDDPQWQQYKTYADLVRYDAV